MSFGFVVTDAFKTRFAAEQAGGPKIVFTSFAVGDGKKLAADGVLRLTPTTVERERFLLNRLTQHPESEERFISAFLMPPLYSTAFSSGFGTLYTAAYLPREGAMQLWWPDHVWNQSFSAFTPASKLIVLPEDAPDKYAHPH